MLKTHEISLLFTSTSGVRKYPLHIYHAREGCKGLGIVFTYPTKALKNVYFPHQPKETERQMNIGSARGAHNSNRIWGITV